MELVRLARLDSEEEEEIAVGTAGYGPPYLMISDSQTQKTLNLFSLLLRKNQCRTPSGLVVYLEEISEPEDVRIPLFRYFAEERLASFGCLRWQ